MFVEIVPLKPELGFIILGPGAVVDAVNVELPSACEDCAFKRNAVTDLPAKFFSDGCAHNGALPVSGKLLPLRIGDADFWKDLALVLDIHRKTGKEVAFVLVHA